MFRRIAYGLAFLLCAIGSASAEDAKATYPAMAPLAQYQMATVADETALASTPPPCAPFSPAISKEHSGFSPAFQSPA